MLQVERQVRAVQSVQVVAVCPADVYGFVQGLSQITAHNVFVAEFGSHGCTSQLPVEIAVQVDAEDVGAVVVEGHLVF